MDLEKYKNNPKTAYLFKTYQSLADEESKNLILAEMDRLLEDNVVEENDDLPNEIILEVRAGAGGDEADIFAHDLANMYINFAKSQNWQVSLISDLVYEIKGMGVYEELRYETGVHRIQRVPETEKMGR